MLFLFGVLLCYGVCSFEFNSDIETSSQESQDSPWSSWLAGPPCPIGYAPIDFSIVQKDASVQRVLKELQMNVIQYLKRVNDTLGIKAGISLQIVYGQQVLFDLNEGVTNASNPKSRPTPDTVYRVGSITKIFTSLMMSKLTEEKLVRPSDPLSLYFNDAKPPKWDMGNPYTKSEITLEMLASHTSGIGREPPCSLFPPPQCDENITFLILSKINLLFPPETHALYSNLGCALLGRALARSLPNGNSTTKYEEYVKEMAMKIGLKSTGFVFNNEIKNKMAIGYKAIPFAQKVDETNYHQMGWPSPAGGLYSNCNDMGNFMKFLWNDKDDFIGRTTKTQYFLSRFGFKDGVSHIGSHTFETLYENGTYVYTKAGLLSGYGSSIAMIPQMKFGVVAFYNLNSGDVTSLTTRAINLLKPVLLDLFKKNVPVPPLYPQMEQFLGNYGIKEDVLVTISKIENTTSTFQLAFNFLPNRDINYTLFYDPQQDMKDGYFPNTIGFRYIRHYPPTASCLVSSLEGDSSVLYLAMVDVNSTITAVIVVPELRLWGYPKMSNVTVKKA